MRKLILALFLTTLILTTLNLTACSGGGGSNNSVFQSVGPNGGTVKSDDGSLTMTIPKGLLDEEITFSLIALGIERDTLHDGGTLLKYGMSPAAFEFKAPVKIEYSTTLDQISSSMKTISGYAPLLFSILLRSQRVYVDNAVTSLSLTDSKVKAVFYLDTIADLEVRSAKGAATSFIAISPGTIPATVSGLGTKFTVNPMVAKAAASDFSATAVTYQDQSSAIVGPEDSAPIILGRLTISSSLTGQIEYSCKSLGIPNGSNFSALITLSNPSGGFYPLTNQISANLLEFNSSIRCTGSSNSAPTRTPTSSPTLSPTPTATISVESP
jgi:hypothetical protein